MKNTWNKIKQKPIYLILTFAGFTLSIVAGLLIYLWVYQELSYDKFHADYSRIYRVLTLTKQGDNVVKSVGSYMPLASTLKNDYPQIEEAACISYDSETSPLQANNDKDRIEVRKARITKRFFKVFQGFKFIEGNSNIESYTPNQIIISKEVKEKIFGDSSAIGKTLVSDKYKKYVYVVAAVVDIPYKSSIQFDFLIPDDVDKKWNSSYWDRVYIKLAPNAVIDNNFKAELVNHIQKYSPVQDKLLFQPLSDVHLKSDYDDMLNTKTGSLKYIWIFSLMGIFVLFMASFNFSLFSAARSSEQAKEIGIRKVSGASRMQLIISFLQKLILQTSFAAVLGLCFLYILLPFFNRLLGENIHIQFSFGLVIGVVLLVLIVSISAGLYPSLYLSALNPVKVFKGGNAKGTKNSFIKLLVVVQFTFAFLFLISTGFLLKQLNYIRAKDLGLQKSNVIVIPTGLWYDSGSFKDEILKNPNVLAASASTFAPVDLFWTETLSLQPVGKEDSIKMSLVLTDQDFAKTYQIKVLKGEYFRDQYKDYWKQMENNYTEKNDSIDAAIPIVINETAEKMIGVPDIIGKRLGNKKIVGVVKDFHYRSLRYPIQPIMLKNDPEGIMTMNVLIAGKNKKNTIDYISGVYKKHRKGREMPFTYFEDMLTQVYTPEIRLKNITLVLSVIALIISLLGILGMSIFSINQRVKEIGIRKVNGARVDEILLLLNTSFIKWILISFVIAIPIAYYAMHKWLQTFAYKTPLSWWIFALAGLVALTIALLTVSWQSWRAATRNPVEALRYE